MAGHHDFYIGKGTKFTSRLKLYNDEDVAIDLTGYTGRMYIKRNENEDLIVEPTISISGNQIDIEILKADTSKLVDDLYLYDLEIFEADDEPLDLMYGKIIVRSRTI